MPYSDEELKRLGTDPCIFRNHMMEMDGYEPVEPRVERINGSLHVEARFPGFARSQIAWTIGVNSLECIAQKGEDKRYFGIPLPEYACTGATKVTYLASRGILNFIIPIRESKSL